MNYGVKKIKLNVKGASPLQDVMVFGDYVAPIWYSPEFRPLWFKQNRGSKKAEDIDITNHLTLMWDNKSPITVIVAKNSTIADDIRKAYLEKVGNLQLT